jgi:hypothetical protein
MASEYVWEFECQSKQLINGATAAIHRSVEKSLDRGSLTLTFSIRTILVFYNNINAIGYVAARFR